jgi:predicted lysophospholipase L1 biosynthesis ABC-type transport system permease subunit
MRVVGQAVFPAVGDPIPVADGALLTAEGMQQVDDPDDDEGYDVLAVTWGAPGARTRAVEQLPGQLGEPPLGPTLPVDVDRLTQIDRLPGLLAAFLGFLAVAALGFTLGSSVRRRTRDLALLKTLGSGRRTVRAAVAWQTAIWVVIGVAFGVPLGLIVGRVAWQAVAGGVGVADDISVPVVPVLLVLVTALVVLELVTAWPARVAARLRPAEALRTE